MDRRSFLLGAVVGALLFYGLLMYSRWRERSRIEGLLREGVVP